MHLLAPPDLHHLRAAIGWLELGDPREADAEFQRLSQKSRQHPDVLEVHWEILARQRDWDSAAKVGRALIAAEPDRPSAWLHHAYALRRASNGGVLAAFNALAPVASKFGDNSTIPYNLACYTCQLQRGTAETLEWLKLALARGDKKEIFAMALKDPDLEPARGAIVELIHKTGAEARA